jgi:S1-C subfamily serine protease
MDPVVARLKAEGFAVQKVDVDQHQDLVAKYRVSRIPCFVMLRDGQEVARQEGVSHYEQLVEMIRSASPAAPQPPAAGVPGLPEQPTQPTSSPVEPRPETIAPNAEVADAPSVPVNGLLSESTTDRAIEVPKVTDGVPLDESFSLPNTDSVGSLVSHEDLIRSTVRLQVEDRSGHSYGTGTIIHSQGSDAVVLTCGHLFREAKNDGRITVDLQGGTETQQVAGRLLTYDLDRDLGLVGIRTSTPVQAARLAPRNTVVSPGQRVFSCGCDHGQHATVQTSHVTAVGRYAGPPNVEVAGAPVEGRSGGGLFDEQGQLIGVCFAADPSDNEGLFAGLESIHAELNRLGLTAAVPGHEPATGLASNNDRDQVQTAGGTKPMSAAEEALLTELAHRSRGTEVICIIRSPDASVKSEILVLHNVSQSFVEQLSRAGRQRPAHQLATYQVQGEPISGAMRDARLEDEKEVRRKTYGDP